MKYIKDVNLPAMAFVYFILKASFMPMSIVDAVFFVSATVLYGYSKFLKSKKKIEKDMTVQAQLDELSAQVDQKLKEFRSELGKSQLQSLQNAPKRRF